MRYPAVLLIPVGIVATSLLLTSGMTEDANPDTYTQWCSSCHGANGRDFIGRTWKFGSSPENVERIIREGYPLLGMPAYGEALSDAEISGLRDYVLAQAATERGFAPTPLESIQSRDLSIRVNTVVNGLQTPWGMDFVNDTTLLITEREGRLWKLTSGRLEALHGLPDDIHVKAKAGCSMSCIGKTPKPAKHGFTSRTARTSPVTKSCRRRRWFGRRTLQISRTLQPGNPFL
jgi:hypothetical protein